MERKVLCPLLEKGCFGEGTLLLCTIQTVECLFYLGLDYWRHTGSLTIFKNKLDVSWNCNSMTSIWTCLQPTFVPYPPLRVITFCCGSTLLYRFSDNFLLSFQIYFWTLNLSTYIILKFVQNSTWQPRVAHVGVDLVCRPSSTWQKAMPRGALTAEELSQSSKRRAKSFPFLRDSIRLTRSDAPRGKAPLRVAPVNPYLFLFAWCQIRSPLQIAITSSAASVGA